MNAILHPFRQGHAQPTMFGYATQEHPKLDRFQNAISAVCGVAAGLSIILITFFTLMELVTRNIFASPLGWNVSLIENYLMVIAAYFGIVCAYRSGAHVAVAGLYNWAPPRAQKLLLLLGYVAVIVGLIFLGWAGLSSAVFSFIGGEQPLPGAADVNLPTWTWKALTAVASALGVVVVAVDLARELAGSWARAVTDYEPGDAVAEAQGAVVLDGDSTDDQNTKEG